MKALHSKLAGNTLRLLGQNMNSYWGLVKAFKEGTVKKRPNIPNYLDKDKGRQVVDFNTQTISRKRTPEGYIILCAKTLNLVIPTKQENVNAVRIVPRKGFFVIEVIYEKEVKKVNTLKRYAGIDLGVENLATVVFTDKSRPLIWKGSNLKSINQGYNRLIAKAQEKLPQGQFKSKEIDNLWKNRNNKVEAEIHKATKEIVRNLIDKRISTVVIGNSIGWKNRVGFDKKTKQNFTNIPFTKFISQMKYKCELVGIEVIIQEESYTSKASFVDGDDIPVYEANSDKKYKFSGKRTKRGLYKHKSGGKINADVNGAYNILFKGFPEDLTKRIKRENLNYHPKIINM